MYVTEVEESIGHLLSVATALGLNLSPCFHDAPYLKGDPVVFRANSYILQ